jgi:hypothetical protein
MCIVIDMNTLAPVFNQGSKKHKEFKPVRQWVVEGNGHLVYGGTGYKDELKKVPRYSRLFRLLKDAGRAFEVNEILVDSEHARLIKKTRGTNCDDQHIIAIFIVSGCRLFCSEDSRADKHIKNKNLYPKKHPVPMIYRNHKHAPLLNPKNIVKLSNIN